nr:hypothetical protein [Tanacetum cinerariifolium]
GIQACDVRLVSGDAGDKVIEKGSGSFSMCLQSTSGGGVNTSFIGPDGLNTVSGVIGPDGLNTVSEYCFRCCENCHEAIDCDSDVSHGGGGYDPTADHSS